jgi:hypothetical protein
MILKHRVRDPKPIMMAGMSFLALSLLWPRFIPVTGSLGPDWVDGLRGFLTGAAIGLNLWAAWLGGRRTRGG